MNRAALPLTVLDFLTLSLAGAAGYGTAAWPAWVVLLLLFAMLVMHAATHIEMIVMFRRADRGTP